MFGTSPIGVIDIGSSAIRLEVSAQSFGGHVVLHRAREKICLGEPVFRTGRISRRVLRDAGRAVKHLAEVARSFGATELIAVGTAALREAQNRDEAIAALEHEAAVHIEVISGAEEASLLARAAMSMPSLRDAEFLSCHIGGGSTELSYVRKGELENVWSIPVGSVRLAQIFNLGANISSLELLGMEAYIRRALDAAVSGGVPVPRGTRAVTGSGSMRALARMRGPNHKIVDRELASSAYAEFSHLDRDARAEIAGVGKDRADVLLAASAISALLMERFAIDRLETTRAGLASGIAMRVRKIVSPISEPARGNEAQTVARRIFNHASQLFQALEPELGLEKSARRILALASRRTDTEHRLGATEDERHLAEEVVRRATAINAGAARREKLRVRPNERATVKKLAAIIAVATAIDAELGEALACIDVALARDEGLFILRTRERPSTIAVPKHVLSRLERALSRKIAISAVPLLTLAELPA